MTERCGKWMPRAQAVCAFKLGHYGQCRSAAGVLAQNNYRRNCRDRRAESKDYYDRNRDAIRARVKRYREANKELIAARRKAYREAHPEAYIEQVVSGRKAASLARWRRRKADERDSNNIDPRLETLLGGLIGPSTP